MIQELQGTAIAGNAKRELGGEPLVSHAEVRSMPYPCRAMLAICSDLDETPDRHVYREIARYLNTNSQTCMGPGVGLEVGNTIYFDMPPSQFSYWNTDDSGREMIHSLIRSGHIDCLHSFGDFANTRAFAGRALDALARNDCHLGVWIDHAVTPTNFGADIMLGSGDLPGAPAYHADLTCDFGVRYVWRGRVTSAIGQNVDRSLQGIWNSSHPLQSARTVMKEFAKGSIAPVHSKYAMNARNRILRPVRLRDGRAVFEFMRSNPSWGGISCFDTADGIAQVLTRGTLDRLVQRGGACILYTHLGKIRDPREPFQQATRRAFQLLAEYAGREIMVTTTRRLLGYFRSIEDLTISLKQSEPALSLEISTPLEIGVEIGRSDLAGLTVYVPETQSIVVSVNGRQVRDFHVNPPDHTGRRSISLPWTPLEFPADV